MTAPLSQLVNTEHDSLQTNERVQECLQNAKLARKQIVRYIQVSDTDHHSPVNPPFNYLLAQLVENEDMIGTLIDTNDRIIASIEMYDAVSIRLAIFTQESFLPCAFPDSLVVEARSYGTRYSGRTGRPGSC